MLAARLELELQGFVERDTEAYPSFGSEAPEQ